MVLQDPEVVQKGIYTSTFTIDNHTAFKRDKENLYASVDLDLYKAI
jgi:curved DNA-binding protein